MKVAVNPLSGDIVLTPSASGGGLSAAAVDAKIAAALAAVIDPIDTVTGEAVKLVFVDGLPSGDTGS